LLTDTSAFDSAPGARRSAESARSAQAAAQRAHLFYRGLIGLVAAGAVGGGLWYASTVFRAGPISGTLDAPEFPQQGVSYKTQVSGSDSKQLPFSYRAERGYQDRENRDIIHLETFNGTFRQASGSDLTVSGASGTFDQKSKTLNLSGNVEVKRDGRFEAQMEKAEFNTDNRSLASKSPVTVKTDNGHIAADSLVSENDGGKLIFRGNVKARFD
jgi:LPS export ABC transporter protein LptC